MLAGLKVSSLAFECVFYWPELLEIMKRANG